MVNDEKKKNGYLGKVWESMRAFWGNDETSSFLPTKSSKSKHALCSNPHWKLFLERNLLTFVFSFSLISLFRASRIFSRRVWNIQLLHPSQLGFTKYPRWEWLWCTKHLRWEDNLSFKHCSHWGFLIAVAFLQSNQDEKVSCNQSWTRNKKQQISYQDFFFFSPKTN